MENASKALIIAGAILLSILIIAIGIFIFNGANSTITDSMTSMSTQEIQSFNNQFDSYSGEQSGSNVKKMVERLIANANTYAEEVRKLPTVKVYKGSTLVGPRAGMHAQNEETLQENATLQKYIDNLTTIRSSISDKHKYKVNIGYGSSGIIDHIFIHIL